MHVWRRSEPLSALAALAPLLRTFGWTHATLQKAQLGGGEGGDAAAYAGWVDAHAARWPRLAAACDDCVEAAAAAAAAEGAEAAAERARMAAATTRSLMYAWVYAAAKSGG